MSRIQEKTLRMVHLALLAAIIVVLQQIVIPLPGGLTLSLTLVPIVIGAVLFGPAAGAALGALKASGVPQFPEFRFGQNPDAFYGMASDVNKTVNTTGTASGSQTDHVIVGDFANSFRWGYAKNIPMEVIQYGDPDGQGDLKRTNEVVLRAEAYIGWGILNPAAFAIVKA